MNTIKLTDSEVETLHRVLDIAYDIENDTVLEDLPFRSTTVSSDECREIRNNTSRRIEQLKNVVRIQAKVEALLDEENSND